MQDLFPVVFGLQRFILSVKQVVANKTRLAGTNIFPKIQVLKTLLILVCVVLIPTPSLALIFILLG